MLGDSLFLEGVRTEAEDRNEQCEYHEDEIGDDGLVLTTAGIDDDGEEHCHSKANCRNPSEEWSDINERGRTSPMPPSTSRMPIVLTATGEKSFTQPMFSACLSWG